MGTQERALLRLYAGMVPYVVSGWLFALGLARLGWINLPSLPTTPWVRTAAEVLLAIGIYFAVRSITYGQFSKLKRLVIVTITFMVLVKWGIMSVTVFWFIGPMTLMLSVVHAQIDPLADDATKASSRMSPSGKAVRTMTATMDDLVTSATFLFVAGFLLLFGFAQLPVGVSTFEALGPMLPSILLLSIAVLALRHLNRSASKQEFVLSDDFRLGAVGLSALVVTVVMHTTAVVWGFLFRPKWLEEKAWANAPRWMPGRVREWLAETERAAVFSKAVFRAVLFLLGVLIASVGINFADGWKMGTAAFYAQIPAALAAFAVYRWWCKRDGVRVAKFTRADVVLFCLGQVLGITAWILAMLAESLGLFPGQGFLAITVGGTIVCNAWNLFFLLIVRLPAIVRWMYPDGEPDGDAPEEEDEGEVKIVEIKSVTEA